MLGLPFKVNDTTGVISTLGELDRETNTNFTFVIVVRTEKKNGFRETKRNRKIKFITWGAAVKDEVEA